MKKQLQPLSLFLGLMIVIAVPGGHAQSEDVGGLLSQNARLPVYHQNRLQFIISAGKVVKQAEKILSSDTVIDIIRKGVDVNSINYLDNVQPYPLGTPLKEVLTFWSDKLHSEGFIVSSQAEINQTTQVAVGEKPVFLRTPALDLDGVGFVADYGKKTVLVRKNVNIVARPESNQKNTFETKGNYLRAKADSMLAEFDKNLITLTGNVEVNEARFALTCDKLELYLKNQQDETVVPKDKDKDTETDALTAQVSGVSKIICYNKVEITRTQTAEERKQHGIQQAVADHVVYRVSAGEFILTGNPRLTQGDDFISGREILIWHDQERMKVNNNCRIHVRAQHEDKSSDPTIITSDYMDLNYAENLIELIGQVRIRDSKMDVDCHKIQVFLQPATAVEQKSPQAAVSAEDSLIRFNPGGGNKEVSKVVCIDNVQVDEPRAMLNCDHLLLTFKTFSPKDGGPERREINKIFCTGRVRLENKPVPGTGRQQTGKDTPPPFNKTVVTSNKAIIHLLDNYAELIDQVKVRDQQASVDCRKMKIFFEPSEEKQTAQPVPVTNVNPLSQLGSDSSGKEITRIVCENDVKAEEPRARLNCDRLELTFRDRPISDGEMPAAGTFGVGGQREIDEIFCDGNVRLENKPDPQKNAPDKVNADTDITEIAKSGSLGKTVMTSDKATIRTAENFAEMIGNVMIEEERFNLACRKMEIYAKPATSDGTPTKRGYADAHYENEVPRQIGIGEDKELEKIVCIDDVVITRNRLKDEGLQQAKGDNAVYHVAERKIVLTGDERRPTMQQGPNIMEGSIITLWTDSEKLDIEDGRLQLFDTKQLQQD